MRSRAEWEWTFCCDVQSILQLEREEEGEEEEEEQQQQRGEFIILSATEEIRDEKTRAQKRERTTRIKTKVALIIKLLS
jgi:hypothetical protein